ncbi:MAG: restriction endonuclease, partial [Firmicutes bacterium]|nr:restriction endonuclease [Bacillota bacterium]
KNIRYITEEIDLCCANLSNDSRFWNMGGLILVECKNQNKKVPVSTIRSLSQIMEYKGISTLLLFTRSEITSAAKQEIKKQQEYGKYFICINFTDLIRVNNNNTPKEVLQEKLIEYFG